jgi:hypothetical protein
MNPKGELPVQDGVVFGVRKMSRREIAREKAELEKNSQKLDKLEEQRAINARQARDDEWERHVEEVRQMGARDLVEMGRRHLEYGLMIFQQFAPSAQNLFLKHTESVITRLCGMAQAGDRDLLRYLLDTVSRLLEELHQVEANLPGTVSSLPQDNRFFFRISNAPVNLRYASEFVRRFVDGVEQQRSEMDRAENMYRILKSEKQPETLGTLLAVAEILNRPGLEKLKRMTLNTYLIKMCGYTAEQLKLRELPSLGTKTWETWWDGALRPHLERKQTGIDLSVTPLWAQCKKRAYVPKKPSTADHASVIDEVKKVCQPALRSLAKSRDFPTK